MTQRKKPSVDDIDLFRRSIGPVRKISHDKTSPVKRSLPPRPQQHRGNSEPLLPDTLSDARESHTVSAEESLLFARPGLQLRQLQRLKRGQLPMGAELDMHGMTTAIARAELVAFIATCGEQHIRCVHIIHGKGYGSGNAAPILKNRLNSWLQQLHEVLAFSSAQPKDGGSGALYVLLRSKR